MRHGALTIAMIIILSGVGWFLFSSVQPVEAPRVVDDGVHDNDIVATSTDSEARSVTNFAECAAAGEPIMESYPRRCAHEGVVYTEFVSQFPEDESPVACTADAKICPDGSAVGRRGPDCSFAPCPGEVVESVFLTCSPESRQALGCPQDYAPVCAQVQVQCITAPCDPVPETFFNACMACSNERVLGFSEGSCN